jgi:thioredoxin-like negative regulator of GroEL
MRLLFAILVSAFLALSTSRANLLDDAILAHRAGVPEVSITKLRIFLASNAAPDQAEAANILLARCLIETQKTKEASEALEHAKGPEAEFLRAQEALRSRRWKEAIDRFALLLKTPDGPLQVEARLGLSAAQKALGQSEAALTTLQPLMQSQGPINAKTGLLAAEVYLSRSEKTKAKEILPGLKQAPHGNRSKRFVWAAKLRFRMEISKRRLRRLTKCLRGRKTEHSEWWQSRSSAW